MAVRIAPNPTTKAAATTPIAIPAFLPLLYRRTKIYSVPRRSDGGGSDGGEAVGGEAERTGSGGELSEPSCGSPLLKKRRRNADLRLKRYTFLEINREGGVELNLT
ncbi:hypothetical protein L1987_44075 [Smallanthus sonchifolius]|uniref:Uncharacterized protein n=1 Tax=Smallanthus sonchifolius TaxID=185202 RepID=A0ACB9GNK5_9ASTR|nr:hypothetical protein L1987_44075 [Smallanthus sonchifolius]